MVTKKGPWSPLRLDETTIKNFVEVDPHSDSDATKIAKDTHTRSSVQPNIPTDELSSKSSSIRAVAEKLLVSSLVSRESTILQPTYTESLDISSIDLQPSILHSSTKDVLLESTFSGSLTDSLEVHRGTFYKSPSILPSTTFFLKDSDTRNESSATQLLKDSHSYSTTFPTPYISMNNGEESKSVSSFTPLTTAVSEYATTEKGLKRTDLLMSSIVLSEPIKSVSSSLHTQHPMSFDKVVRITSSSFSAAVEDNFHQPQLFSITSTNSDKTFHSSPLSLVKSDNEFRSSLLSTSDISTMDVYTLNETSVSSADSVILTPEQTVSLIVSTTFDAMIHASSLDNFGNFSTITTSELSTSKESDYKAFAFDEQSLFSERSSTISPHASTESTDALFNITSVEGLLSKSSIGKYSSEIITSDTNINTDVIGSRYDVDTDDVITLTQDTMEIGRDDLTKDSFRSDTVNLDSMASLRFKPTRTTQSLMTDTLRTVYITDNQQISPFQTNISKVNYLHSSEAEKSVPVNQTRYIGIPHEISDIDSLKQHNNITIKSSQENTNLVISLPSISEKSVDVEPMLLSSSKDELYIQSNAPTAVSRDITGSSVSDHQSMSVDSLLYTSYKQEKATTKSLKNTEQVLSITQPMKIQSVFSSKDEHPSNIPEPIQNVFTNVPMERTIDMALDSKYPAHLISEQSVIFEPLHTSMLQQEVDSALSLKQITTNYVSTRHTSELPTEFDPLLTSSSSYQSKVLKSVGGTSIKTHRLLSASSYFQHTTSSTIQLLATTPIMPTDAKLLSTIDSPLQTEMPAKASSSIPLIIEPNGSHSINVSMSVNIVNITGHFKFRNDTTTGHLESRNITTIEDFEFLNTTKTGDLESHNITTGNIINVDLKLRNITTPTEDLDSQIITTPMGDLDSRNITTPTEDLDSQNITTPMGNLDSQHITTPIRDLHSQNITTPTEDLDSQNITTTIGDLDSQNITAPTEYLDFRNITTPIGDLDSRNITTPIGDLNFRNVKIPIGDLDSRNITTPTEDLDSRNLTRSGNLESRQSVNNLIKSRNTTTTGDFKPRNIATPTGYLESRNITNGHLTSQNITSTGDNITTVDLVSRTVTISSGDLESRQDTTEVSLSRNTTIPTGNLDIEIQNITTADIEIQNITTTADIEIQNLTTTRDIEIQNITTSTDIEIQNLTTTGDIEIQNIKTTGDIKIHNITTNGDIEIQNITTTADNEVQNMTTTADNAIQNMTTTAEIEIRNMTATGDIEIQNITTIGDIEIQNITITVDNEIQNMTTTGDIELQDITTTADNEIQNMTTTADIEIQCPQLL